MNTGSNSTNGSSASSGALKMLSFHGDEIATLQSDGKPVVAMRRIVENMGLSWGSQHGKLLAQKQKFSCTDIGTRDTRGNQIKMFCMPIDKLPLWLATINPNKIKNVTIRSKVELYQAESAIALHDYWTKGAAIRGDMDGLVTDLAPSVRKAIGGIVKDVVNARLAEALANLTAKIEASRIAPTFDYSSTVSSSEVIEMAGILPGQRVRGTSTVVTYAMLDFCGGLGCVRTAAELNRARPWRFPSDKAREWLFGSHLGAEQIRNQIARRHRAKRKTGQGTFSLVAPFDQAVP